MDLCDLLLAQSDPVRASAEQAYLKSELPCIGVRVPQVRAIARNWARQRGFTDGSEFWAVLHQIWDNAEYRDERKAVLAIALDAKWRIWTQNPSALEHFRYFIVTGAWWDLVDEAAHGVDEILYRNPEVEPIIRRWSRAENLWMRRVSIICQLSRKAETDPELLRFCIEGSLGDRQFFAQKAIGWALRQYARVDPDWVRETVAELGLTGLARREALKYL